MIFRTLSNLEGSDSGSAPCNNLGKFILIHFELIYSLLQSWSFTEKLISQITSTPDLNLLFNILAKK